MRPTTQRAHSAVPVFISGYDHSGQPFKEITKTLTISPDGGFVELAAPVAGEYPLLLINMATGHCISCHATSVHTGPDGKAHVCIVFAAPSPQFWGIEFPPEQLHRATRRSPEREVA